MQLHRIARHRSIALASVTLLVATLLSPVRADAIPKPTQPPPAPVNPSNSALNSASAVKNAAASEVGRIGGEIAAAQAELQRLRGKQELAEQKLALAISRLEDAKAQAAAARRRVQAAARAVVQARREWVQYLQVSYMGGDLGGTTGSLLTAQDPSALLDRGTLEQYQADKRINAMGKLQRATVAKSNADAQARAAVQRQAKAAKAAKEAKAAADQAVADAKAQEASLEATLVQKQGELQAAQLRLATLNGQRANFVVWQGKQARYERALSAWKEEQARIERARAAAARARALAAARRHHHHSGSSGGSSGGSSYSSGPSAPTTSHWTSAAGRAAVKRAKSTLGTIYIWAGGNRWGPTDGGCTDPVSPCGTVGYDCSGLVLYAWGRSWDHYAATQYSQAGSYHPPSSKFRQGDLLFWSEDGTRSGIGHVAIYVGDGNVIQAPQSGDYVKITPWTQVEAGYYGATRPLT